MLARHGAELVLHGHAHAHLVSYLEGPQRRVPVVGVPSASEVPPGEHDAAAYNLYRIGRDGAGLELRGDLARLFPRSATDKASRNCGVWFLP